MAHTDDEKRALGKRLASARKLAGFTIDGAAKALTAKGHPITKQAIGHWETGTNLPDALWLKRLAKLYSTILDALVWDESISMEAVQIAVQYDGLNDADKRRFRAMWLAFFEQAKSDAEVAQHLPMPPQEHATRR